MTIGQELEAKDNAAKKEGFAKWMDQPATRMMMSMIPPGEKQEVLQTLLQEAYNSGYVAGGGKTAALFMEAMFKNIDKREPR